MSNASFAQFFSRRLVGLRNRLGLSQQALADKCGVHVRSVQGWEKDGVIPHGKTLHNLAAALEVEVAYLTDEDYRPRQRTAEDLLEGEDPKLEAEIWKRRAKEAEQELADIKAALRLLAENRRPSNKATPHQPGDPSSSEPSGAAILTRRAAGEDVGRSTK